METTRKLRVFIGCASESTTTADRIAAIVKSYGHEPLVWTDRKAFLAGEAILSKLIEHSRTVDAAILIFSPDDETVSRGTRGYQPRDNVLMEYGLFAGTLGQKRSVICTTGELKMPVDVAGIVYIDFANEWDAKLRLKEWLDSIQAQPADPEVIGVGLFKSSNHERFTERIRMRLTVAKSIVMMGSGVAILGRPDVVDDLMRRAKAGQYDKVEIYLANPFSPAVEIRLIEEEQGSVKPPDGKRGLLDRLETLLHCWIYNGRPTCVKIKLCDHYPTFALLIIDGDYFVYPYSYRLLGNFSPVLAFSSNNPAHQDFVTFLTDHYQRIRSDALEAEQILHRPKFFRDDLSAFAVFFVPSEDSDLYKFGSAVIGYDVRSRQQVDSQWQAYVGQAAQFGIHLTICDALYFRNNAEVVSAIAEVIYLAKEFSAFELRHLRLKHDYPRKDQVAISIVDASDELHSLHSELVHRLYRRAVASDYTLKHASIDQGIAGNGLHMMNRYHAPFILNRFQPHFTLFSNCGSEDWKRCKKDLDTLFTPRVSRCNVTVDRLAIMGRSAQDGKWSILGDEIQLG